MKVNNSLLKVINIAIIVMLSLNMQGCKNKENEVNITNSEIRTMEYEGYESEVFTMQKPKDWTVDASGVDIYYVIRVYDPNNSNNQIFLQLKMQPLLKSDAAKQFYKEYAALGNAQAWSFMTEAVVLDEATTEGFYKKFDEITFYEKSYLNEFVACNFPYFTDFKRLMNMNQIQL